MKREVECLKLGRRVAEFVQWINGRFGPLPFGFAPFRGACLHFQTEPAFTMPNMYIGVRAILLARNVEYLFATGVADIALYAAVWSDVGGKQASRIGCGR